MLTIFVAQLVQIYLLTEHPLTEAISDTLLLQIFEIVAYRDTF